MAAPFGVLPGRVVLLSLLLAVVGLQQAPTITVDVNPNPSHVNSQVIFTAKVSAPVKGQLLYRFFVDDQLLTGGWQDSPQYTYVPQEAGSHVVHAEAGERVTVPGGRRAAAQTAIRLLNFGSTRSPFEVQPQVAPPTGPLALTLKLTSSEVVAGKPASFAVSIAGAPALPVYVLDPGDGSALQTRSDAEFTHVYQNAGVFTASVNFPAGTLGTGSSVAVNVGAPLALTLRLTSSRVVAGEPASFAVSVEGADALPPYVLDAGDGSAPQTRSDAEFTHVYQSAGVFTASVALPAGTPGTASSVAVNVQPLAAPLALTLRLTSPRVVAGELASFAVSVEGAAALPQYVLDAGDGSAPQIRGDAAFTHVYQNAGVFTASVSFPAGIPGRGSTVVVDVASGTTRTWLLAVVALLAIAGAIMVRRARRKHVDPAVVPTLHPEPDFEPRFNPAKPPGIAVEIHLVPNLANLQFTRPVRISREG